MRYSLQSIAGVLGGLVVLTASTAWGLDLISFKTKVEKTSYTSASKSDSGVSESTADAPATPNPFKPETIDTLTQPKSATSAAEKSDSGLREMLIGPEPGVKSAAPLRLPSPSTPAARSCLPSSIAGCGAGGCGSGAGCETGCVNGNGSGLGQGGRLQGIGCPADCEDCPRIGSMFFEKAEVWRNIADGSYADNKGLVVGGNVGVPLPKLREWGIGGQFGASYGAYDLDGRASSDRNNDVQQQIFVTAGLFHRPTESCPLGIGVGYDWMINSNYGVYATSPMMTQWRAQIGYALSARNEVGVWMSMRDRGADKEIEFNNQTATAHYRPLDQVNIFWHHNYCSGADSWLWMGFPDNDKVGGDGRLGEFTLGFSVNVPLTERVALTAGGSYMKPTASSGIAASVENAYSLSVGLAIFPGAGAKRGSVAGNCWMPYLPLADNMNFLSDTNATLY